MKPLLCAWLGIDGDESALARTSIPKHCSGTETAKGPSRSGIQVPVTPLVGPRMQSRPGAPQVPHRGLGGRLLLAWSRTSRRASGTERSRRTRNATFEQLTSRETSGVAQSASGSVRSTLTSARSLSALVGSWNSPTSTRTALGCQS